MKQTHFLKTNKITPENMARIIMYDYDEVISKLKIKKAPKQAIVSRAIIKHNTKTNEIKAFNYETFDNVKSFLTKKSEEAKLSRDYSTMRESQMKANEMMAPIRSKVMEQKKTLNTTLENELSEKQFKKWLKYQEGELNKLYPKASNSSKRQRSQSYRGSGSRQRTGVGRGRY